MDAVHELIGLVSDKVGAIAQSDVVIGSPIELGAVTIVPLSRISVGFGGGGGTGEAEPPRKKNRRRHRGKGTGAGSAGGGKVRPVGVIIFGPDGVDVQPIADKKGLLDKLFEKVPELVDKLHTIFDGGDDRTTDEAIADAMS